MKNTLFAKFMKACSIINLRIKVFSSVSTLHTSSSVNVPLFLKCTINILIMVG